MSSFTENPTSQPITFQGATNASMNHAVNEVFKQSPLGLRVLGKGLHIKEGDSGFSIVTFLQDTLVTLLPKWVIARSTAETVESSFLELAESAILYFGLPVLATKVFSPIFNRTIQKHPITDALKGTPRFINARAATILATFGLTLVGGEFVTNYVKNIITAKCFNKDSFSDIVNLSQGKMDSHQPSPVIQKCETRIKQCLAACVGIYGFSLLLARPELLTRVKLGALKEPLENLSKRLVKYLDFDEGKNGKLCLSRKQQIPYMLLAVFAYLDSARDKLEQVEVASRLAVILPYLAWGQGALEKGLLKLAPKYFAPVPKYFDPIKNVEKVQSISQLAQHFYKLQNGNALAAAKEMAIPIKRKAVLTGVPLGFGILGTGIIVGKLSQFWTKYRYQNQLKSTAPHAGHQSEHPSSNTLAFPPHGTTQTVGNFDKSGLAPGFSACASPWSPNPYNVQPMMYPAQRTPASPSPVGGMRL